MQRRKVLIVDDDADVLHALSTRLRSQGYLVTAAFDGAHAAARFRSERPDLLLLDVHLSAGTGLSLCDQLRREPGGAPVPVIAMTADPSQETKQRCEERGCFAFFRKPYNSRKLLAKIDQALGDR